MAYAAPILDDEEKKKQEQGAGVNISGQASSFDTVPGQEATQGSKPQKSSGQYANLQSYLDANRTQGDSMGMSIAGNVESKAQDAENKINTFGSAQYKADNYDPNDALNRATSLNDQEKAQYKQVKQTGGYSGPATIDQAQGYQETQKAAQDAVQDVKNTGNEYGQQKLLKQTYNRPQYSAGENKLDQVLLQNSAGSKQALQNVGSRYSNLQNYLDQTNERIGQDINNAQAQSLSNKQKFQPAEQMAVKNLMDPIQMRVNDANANNNALIDRVEDDIGDLTLTDETMQALGMNENERLYNLNLAGYLNRDRSQVGLDNVATADERARYTALQSLLDDPTMSQITPNGRQINPISLDRNTLNRDLAAAQDEFTRNAAVSNHRGVATGNLGLFANDSQYAGEMTVADYLAGKDPTINFVYGPESSWHLEGDAVRKRDALIQQAKDQIKNQILAWLDEQGYNNVIGRQG